MRSLSVRVASEVRQDYDGTPLAPHWIRRRFGLKGDAAVAFIGACEVRGERLVDLEDREAGDFIYSPEMVHVLVECFGADLARMIFIQRLLASHAADLVREATGRADVRRSGDDVYLGDAKLSVSIATLSPLSGLVHFGVNVRSEGAPVRAIGLAEIDMAPVAFAQALLARFSGEIDSIIDALGKVRPAHGRDD